VDGTMDGARDGTLMAAKRGSDELDQRIIRAINRHTYMATHSFGLSFFMPCHRKGLG